MLCFLKLFFRRVSIILRMGECAKFLVLLNPILKKKYSQACKHYFNDEEHVKLILGTLEPYV
jgi:hypothetical protein